MDLTFSEQLHTQLLSAFYRLSEIAMVYATTLLSAAVNKIILLFPQTMSLLQRNTWLTKAIGTCLL